MKKTCDKCRALSRINTVPSCELGHPVDWDLMGTVKPLEKCEKPTTYDTFLSSLDSAKEKKRAHRNTSLPCPPST